MAWDRVDIKELVKNDGELMGRMYFDYREYYIRKGVDEELLMSFAEWCAHLGLD